ADDQVEHAKQMPKVEKFRATFRGLIEEGLAAGALEPMDAHRLAWALGGILRMFIFGALVEQLEPSLTALAPTIARLFLHGASPREGPKETPATRDKPERESHARRPRPHLAKKTTSRARRTTR